MAWANAADLLSDLDEERSSQYEAERFRPLLAIRSEPQPPEDGVSFRASIKPTVRLHHAASKLSKRRDPVTGQWRYRIRCTCGWIPVSHSTEARARGALNRHVELAL